MGINKVEIHVLYNKIFICCCLFSLFLLVGFTWIMVSKFALVEFTFTFMYICPRIRNHAMYTGQNKLGIKLLRMHFWANR